MSKQTMKIMHRDREQTAQHTVLPQRGESELDQSAGHHAVLCSSYCYKQRSFKLLIHHIVSHQSSGISGELKHLHFLTLKH